MTALALAWERNRDARFATLSHRSQPLAALLAEGDGTREAQERPTEPQPVPATDRTTDDNRETRSTGTTCL